MTISKTSNEVSPARRLGRRGLLRIVVAVAVVTVVALLYLTPAREWMTVENVRRAVEKLRSLWYGPLIFMGIQIVGCVFAVPASIFVIAAGLIWGWILGGVYALFGSALGATAAFLVARFVGEGLLKKFGSIGMRLEKQLEKAGFGSMLILRLIPIFPFVVLNYASGVAGIGIGVFFLSTFLGSAPAHFVITYSADALVKGTMSGGDAFLRMLLAGLLLAALALIPMLLKKFVQRRVPTEEPWPAEPESEPRT